MNNSGVILGLLGLAVGSLITFVVMKNNPTGAPLPRIVPGIEKDMEQMKEGQHGMNMSMIQMSESLRGLSGDDFDKKFLEQMIDHHQGAIDMAELGKKQAKHEELKTLSNDIITAQTKEIAMMKDWQSKWNYQASNSAMVPTDISWEQAKTFLSSCKVTATAETHSGYLNLTLTDGSVKKTKEYKQDELYNIINQANSKCGSQISIGME